MEIRDIEILLALKDNKILTYNISEELKRLKRIAIESAKEDETNYIWCLEQIYTVKKLFIGAFNQMKEGKFQEAWYSLDRCDIELHFLKPHFNYSDNSYHLLFIEDEIPKYQKLFPYDLFASRESIESDFTCSICGAKMGIRNKCGHKVGGIYNGEMCCRIVNKIEFVAIALVRKPFDKYTILNVEGREYNYLILQNLMKYLDNPFEKWGYEIELREWNYKNDERYKNTQRNDLCPCGSGKKFKKCCLISKDKVKHYKIWGENKKFHEKPLCETTFKNKVNIPV
jgi:hypothetical protein